MSVCESNAGAQKPKSSGPAWTRKVSLFTLFTLPGSAVAVGLQLGSPVSRIACSALHLLFAGVLLVAYCGVIARRKIALVTAPAAIPVLMNLVYFVVSGLKYYSNNPAYPEFGLDLMQRAIGSAGVACVLGLMIAVVSVVCKRQATQSISISDFQVPAWLLALLMLAYVAVLVALVQRGFGSTYSATAQMTVASYGGYDDIALVFVNDSLGSMLTLLLVVSCLQRMSALRAVLCVAFFAAQITWILVVRQNRSMLLTLAILVLVACQLRFLSGGVVWLRRGLTLLPLVAVIGSYSILVAMGRDADTGIGAATDEIAYRLDISDFAVALLGSGSLGSGADVVAGAVINAVPAILYSGKPADAMKSYERAVAGARLYADVDYPDTLFSAGAMLAGIVGFVVWPIVYVVLVEFLCRLLAWVAMRDVLYLVLPVVVVTMNIELGWNELFNAMRQLIMFGMPIGVIAAISARTSAARVR